MKLHRLKDFMWIREAQEDVTAAEFACSVEMQDLDDDKRSKRKRAVDYEKLLLRLNRRITELGCGVASDGSVSCVLEKGIGKGSIVYAEAQRNALLERIIVTRQNLLDVMRVNVDVENEDLFSLSIELPAIRVPAIRLEIPKAPKDDDPSLPGGPKLYVRDDGTVDWDGALQDREALAMFGTSVWARINGRDPETVQNQQQDPLKEADAEKAKEVIAKINETPRIQEERAKLDALKTELREMEDNHISLLSSALSAGQAVANVNLARLEPAQRITIRASAAALESMKEKVSYQTLMYELERIYTYLNGELGNPASTGYIPLPDRLNVAEFGLLESQIDAFTRSIEQGESLDADVLAVVLEQLIDMKRRLGIDYLVTGLSFDSEAIRRWLGDLTVKTKKGLAFYVKGVRLFWNDIVFCFSLVNRAAQGYTLKPREVRTIR
jgi:predicted DNA binding CopG/RHH family protein